MELTGKVIKVLEPMSGTSAKSGEKWVKNSFVLETGGQYPKKAVFTVFGEDKWQKMAIVVNGDYRVSFDIDAHEWNGRWFNEVSAWAATRLDGQQQAQQQSTSRNSQPVPKPKEPQETKESKADDLPF